MGLSTVHRRLESSGRRGGTLAGAAFCDRWRADPRVGSVVLIAGVSDMWVEPLEPPQEGSQRLRIELTWASDSADGDDEASVLVDAVVSAAGDGE